MIQTLPKSLANQIAAGEVVERPISVVKELVENSLDAGAHEISVEIIWWGLDKIIIQDDGFWMTREDLTILWEKHSTSKIHSLEDLFHIVSFGFRGEAIASIASVSHMKISSRHKDSNKAYTKSLSGDEKSSISQDSLDRGTKIEVEALFYNTPARKNYLKSEKTETTHIKEYLQHMSLVYPEVRFSFFQDSKQSFVFPASEVSQRMYQVFGEEFFTQHLEVSTQFVWWNIFGLISNPKIHFWNKNRQILFVNKRLIKSAFLSKAIFEAYNRFIPHGTFPAYVLNIEIDPSIIDVNVHPRKMEIRFADEQEMYRNMYHAVLKVLESSTLIAPSFFEEKTTATQKNISPKYFTSSGTKFAAYSPYKQIQHSPFQNQIDFVNMEYATNTSFLHTKEEDTSQNFSGKIIGQIFRSYIIVEQADNIVFFDQHALAERIIYEKLSATWYIPKLQQLLVPEYIELTSSEKGFLEQNLEIFLQMWFEIELLSGNALHIIWVPDFVSIEQVKEIFEAIMWDVCVEKKSLPTALQEVRNRAWAYTACRSAIKFWHTLSMFEMEELLAQSFDSYTSTCPHGRPVVFQIHKDDLKWRFDR